MRRFIVLLRGVNVGKVNRVAMADFKTLLHSLDYMDVSTLLNSGNAVFTSSGRSKTKHARDIAAALSGSMGVNVAVVVKSSTELFAAVAANPIPVPEQDHSKFLVAFANDNGTLKSLGSLQPLVQPPERLVIGQEAAYLHCAAGILQSKVAEAMLGKVGMSFTTRNWATTLKLLSLCGAVEDHPSLKLSVNV
jgi:uncharacterized protein (DUF1697 family)